MKRSKSNFLARSNTANKGMQTRKPRNRGAQMELFPLMKINLPFFVKKYFEPLNKKEQAEELQMERLGTTSPAGIKEMLNDKTLMCNIQAANEYKKSMHHKRIGKSSNPMDLLKEVEKTAYEKLTESEKEQLSPVKSNPYTVMSTMTKLLSAFKNPNKMTSNLSITSGRLFTIQEPGSYAKTEKEKTKNSLQELIRQRKKMEHSLLRSETQERLSQLRPTKNREAPPTTRGPHKSNMSMILARTIARSYSQNKSANSQYNINGYNQFCLAAENLAQAFSEHRGHSELAKYSAGVKKILNTGPSSSLLYTQNAAAENIKNTSDHLLALEKKSLLLEKTIDKKVSKLLKWIEN